MPFPAYRQPNVVQPQPRSQERVTQFPGNFADIADPGVLNLWLKATGQLEPPRQMTPYGPAGGLLDTRAGVQAPLGHGLLQPAMWDRVRKQLGLLGTEGGGRGMEGGGGRGAPELPLQGGGVRSYNVRNPSGEPPPEPQGPKYDWAYSENSGIFATTLPKSGLRVTAMPRYSRGGRDALDVEFYKPGYDLPARGRGSTKRGIEHFSEVMGSIVDLQKKFNPGRILFSAASREHRLLYDRVAPMLAKALGGKLSKPGSSSYLIDLP